MPYTQENRIIALSTPLGDDVLLLAGLSGRESISRMFSFHLDLLNEIDSGNPTVIDFTQIVGQNVTIKVAQSDSTPRYFNGIVSRFSQSGADSRFVHYQMEVVPWTWMLTRTADCCIFHNKTVREIIELIFQQNGLSDYNFLLNADYPSLEYCVQYRETDFNFISRLMEQNGIFYFYQHEDGKHTMVIADDNTAHVPCPGQETASYDQSTGGQAGSAIAAWNIEQELRTGKYTHTDYNFKTPTSTLASSEQTIVSVGNNSAYEIFDYPGEFAVRGDGTRLAKLRMQEEEAGHLIISGSSSCHLFRTGYKFDLSDHYQPSMNGSYLLTEIQHSASVGGNYSLDQSGAGDTYSNHFTCIPASVNFRPARLTPKPFVQGPQSAVVIGKSDYSSDAGDSETSSAGGESDSGLDQSDGEEIWVDKYGRVVVRFPWDRAGKCSCLVRVSQQWAGEGWGWITIPRVGHEVLVSFLEGDPDRPIITGCVFNAEKTVPYELPTHQTRSTFQSRSTTGGGADNYNELRFEDKSGKEQIFIRGEKDYDRRIKNDSREWIGANDSLIVAGNQAEKIGGSQDIQIGGARNEMVGGDETIQIGGKRIEKVSGDENIQISGTQNEKIGGDLNVAVGGNHLEKVGGDQHSKISGNINQKAGQTISIQAGENLYEKSGMNFAHEAGMALHLKAGMTMVLEAGMQLSLKVGGNFIDIGPAGVSITGTMVMINSGGAAGSGCGSSPTDPQDPATPADPKNPKDPDTADDGSKGTKM